jgi:hypothetical protein
MDAKESVLRKLDALLRLGPPDPFERVPDYDISPERLKRLKARCAAIAPFRRALSDKEKKVVTLVKIEGRLLAIQASATPTAGSSYSALFEQLEREGYLKAAEERAAKDMVPVRRYQITEVGRKFLDEQLKDPCVAELVKQNRSEYTGA